MKKVLGIVTTVAGIIGMVGSALSMRLWLITVAVMTMLKLTGVLVIPWFAGIFSAGAISTGLWMLLAGFIMLLISYSVAITGVYFMKD